MNLLYLILAKRPEINSMHESSIHEILQKENEIHLSCYNYPVLLVVIVVNFLLCLIYKLNYLIRMCV
jgi:hypothetical protein